MPTPQVIDISHYTTVTSLQEVKNFGVWGIICKCTQGSAFVDSSYQTNRQQTIAVDLLWGAYHFGTNDDPQAQWNNFSANANVDGDTFVALDYEQYDASQMSPSQMVQFLRIADAALGRKIFLYSGSQIKETINQLSNDDAEFVASHPLWLAEYSSTPILPPYFQNYTLWQYSASGQVPGVNDNGGVDVDSFNGTQSQLAAVWASGSAQSVPMV